jgi:hypothetical protein
VQQSKEDINLFRNSGAENEGVMEKGCNRHYWQTNPEASTGQSLSRNSTVVSISRCNVPSINTNITEASFLTLTACIIFGIVVTVFESPY